MFKIPLTKLTRFSIIKAIKLITFLILTRRLIVFRGLRRERERKKRSVEEEQMKVVEGEGDDECRGGGEEVNRERKKMV